jgi:hypothetical protein
MSRAGSGLITVSWIKALPVSASTWGGRSYSAAVMRAARQEAMRTPSAGDRPRRAIAASSGGSWHSIAGANRMELREAARPAQQRRNPPRDRPRTPGTPPTSEEGGAPGAEPGPGRRDGAANGSTMEHRDLGEGGPAGGGIRRDQGCGIPRNDQAAAVSSLRWPLEAIAASVRLRPSSCAAIGLAGFLSSALVRRARRTDLGRGPDAVSPRSWISTQQLSSFRSHSSTVHPSPSPRDGPSLGWSFRTATGGPVAGKCTLQGRGSPERPRRS